VTGSPPTSPPRPTDPNAFRMPSLGADMEYGTLVAWHVKPGDHVRRREVIAEVETQKGVFSVESPIEGVVTELVVAEGTKVPVGTVLATFGGKPVGLPPTPATPAPAAAPARADRLVATHLRASPAARRRASELHLDLKALWSAERAHAITLAEVERAAGTAAAPAVTLPPEPIERPAPPPATDAQRAMRQAVAAAVTRANREIPHYYLSTHISLKRALAWLQARNATQPVETRLLPAALLLKAVALGLRGHPDLNGVWTDGAYHPSDGVHLGVVVSLRAGGIMAPAIHDADRLPVNELMAALRDLVRRSREGGLRGSELTDATATVTNLGDEGVEEVFGVIYPPQVALVGFGRITDRPWAQDGMLGVHPVVTATLAADHRATDGMYGGRFLAAVDRLLQRPEDL
jgi:pyruvate dehydrogenase E2 component (dihydrolipoyllysine-residue acetyltransferase)